MLPVVAVAAGAAAEETADAPAADAADADIVGVGTDAAPLTGGDVVQAKASAQESTPAAWRVEGFIVTG
jgi:hypothetical protein